MANVKISDLTAAAAASSTQQFEVNDSGTSKSVTGAQIAAFVETEVSSSPSFTGDVTIEDKIVHSGDTNTSVRFPAADTVTVETSGLERLRVDSSGNVGVGTATPAVRLEASGGIADVIAGTAQVIARSGDNTNFNQIRVRATATESRLESLAAGTGTSSPLVIHTGGAERMRIDPSGNVLVGTSTSPSSSLAKQVLAGNGVYSQWTRTSTTLGGGYIGTDGNGLVFGTQTGTVGSEVDGGERFRIASAGQIGIGGANYGTSGQVLTSGGSAAAPTWEGVGSLTADLSARAVGTYIVGFNTTTTAVASGGTLAGSSIRYVTTNSAIEPVFDNIISSSTSFPTADTTALTGTWRAMTIGGGRAPTGSNYSWNPSLWLRIS
jgi:hypothetical protein